MSFSFADSFLSRSIVDIREAVDEPIINSKYTDARLIELLEKAYILVLNDINRNSKTPAVVKETITIQSGQTKYILPHVMGSLYGIYHEDDYGGRVYYDGRSRYNPLGQKLWLEGNTLCIQAVDLFGIGTELIAEWIPAGVARLHNGACTLNSAGNVVTLASSPNVGVLDTHHQAYSGSIFRILGVDGSGASGNYLQERIITAYDETKREASLNVALSPIPAAGQGGGIYYEIAPAICKGMDTVVALYTAYRIMITEGNLKRASGILSAYRNEIRNVRLTAYYSNMPEAPRLRGDNFDNRRYRRY